MRNCTFRVAKTKALISFAVTVGRLLVFPCDGSHVYVKLEASNSKISVNNLNCAVRSVAFAFPK